MHTHGLGLILIIEVKNPCLHDGLIIKILKGLLKPFEGGESSAETKVDSPVNPPLIGMLSLTEIGPDGGIKASARTSLEPATVVEAMASATTSKPSKKPSLGVSTTIGASSLMGWKTEFDSTSI